MLQIVASLLGTSTEPTLVPWANVTTNEIVSFIYYTAQGTKVSAIVALLTLVPQVNVTTNEIASFIYYIAQGVRVSKYKRVNV
jgi:hypothetical protein